jgi:hypothetical protein
MMRWRKWYYTYNVAVTSLESFEDSSFYLTRLSLPGSKSQLAVTVGVNR